MALTPEEEAELTALKQELAPGLTPEEEAELAALKAELNPEGQGAMDTARGAIQSVNEGTLLGFGDEIAGAGRALLDYGMDALIDNPLEDVGQSQSFADRYAMYRDDERDVTEQFREENPATAMGLTIAGGIASPANLVGGAPTSLARAAGRAGAEGAVAGFGQGQGFEDSLEGAAQGAGIGLATGGALGLAARGLGKQRIAEELTQADGSVKPINMVEEDGLLQGFYRTALGRTIGGGNKLRQAQKPFLEAADEAVETADDVAKAVAKQGKKEVKQAKAQAKSSLERSVAALDDQVGREAVEAAIPVTMPKELADEARAAGSVSEAERLVSKWWSDEGFGSIKRYSEIPIPNNLMTSVRMTLGKNPQFREALGPDALKMLEDAVEKGELNGSEFLELRNTFARAANKTPSMKGAGSRAMADKFDNLIRGFASKEDFAAYQAELGAWGPKQALSKSARQARRGGRDVTAKDIASKATDASDLQASAGQAIQKQSGLKKALNVDTDDIAERLGVPDRVDATKAASKAAKAKRAELKGKAVPEKPTGLSEYITTTVLGGGILPVGMAASRGLTSDAAMLAMAGQTDWQKALAKMIRDGLVDQSALRAGTVAATLGTER